MKFVKNYEHIHSIEQVISRYKGKVIYLDTWATWCGPCLEEMKYIPALQKRFAGRNIVFLFFSIDNKKDAPHWKDLVNYLGLQGVNIRGYDNDLYHSLLSMLGIKNDDIAIPRYAIIDKEGHWINRDAPRPSEGKKLYLELAKYVNQ